MASDKNSSEHSCFIFCWALVGENDENGWWCKGRTNHEYRNCWRFCLSSLDACSDHRSQNIASTSSVLVSCHSHSGLTVTALNTHLYYPSSFMKSCLDCFFCFFFISSSSIWSQVLFAALFKRVPVEACFSHCLYGGVRFLALHLPDIFIQSFLYNWGRIKSEYLSIWWFHVQDLNSQPSGH